MLQKDGGFTMTHIPYKGTAASVNDLLGEQIPLVFGALTAVRLAAAGKIKLLGVTSEKRYRCFPTCRRSANFSGFQDHQLHRFHAAKEHAETL